MGVARVFQKLGSALRKKVNFDRRKGGKVGAHAQEAVVQQAGQAAAKPVRTRIARSVSQGGVAAGQVKTVSGKGRSYSLPATKQMRRAIAHARSNAISRRASAPRSHKESTVVNVEQLLERNSRALDDLLASAAEPENAIQREAEAPADQYKREDYYHKLAVPNLDRQYEYLLDEAIESFRQSKTQPAKREADPKQAAVAPTPIYAGSSRPVRARVLVPATNARFEELVAELAPRAPEPAFATLPAWDEVTPEHRTTLSQTLLDGLHLETDPALEDDRFNMAVSFRNLGWDTDVIEDECLSTLFALDPAHPSHASHTAAMAWRLATSSQVWREDQGGRRNPALEEIPYVLEIFDKVDAYLQAHPAGESVSDKEYDELVASIVHRTPSAIDSATGQATDVSAELDALIDEFENAGAWMQPKARP